MWTAHAPGSRHNGATHVANGEAATLGQPATAANVDGESKDLPDDRVHATIPVGISSSDAARCVADIKKGGRDHRGEKIEYLFYHRQSFAIYRSGDKVMVHYADDEATAEQQTIAVAELVFLRGRLQFLMSGCSSEDANRYHCLIAEALRLCLDGRGAESKAMMEMLIDTMIEHRLQQGRDVHLISTGLMVLVIILSLCASAAGIWYLWGLAPVAAGCCLMLAIGSGAIGATMSTALALQARNGSAAVKSVNPRRNAIDGVARILIGVASAAALYLFLDSDVLGAIKIGDLILKPDIDWKKAMLVGFMAGFLERLVPDLLEKKFAAVTNKYGSRPSQAAATAARSSPARAAPRPGRASG